MNVGYKAVTFTECPHQPPAAHPQPEADLGWATNVWATEKEKEEKKRKRTRRGGVEKKERKEKEPLIKYILG